MTCNQNYCSRDLMKAVTNNSAMDQMGNDEENGLSKRPSNSPVGHWWSY